MNPMPLMPLENKGSEPNNQALPSEPHRSHGERVSDPGKSKALLTGEAMQTIGLGGLGLGCVALMLIGGPFVAIGFGLAVACAGAVLVLHWREINSAIADRRFTRHLVLPSLIAVIIPLVAIMVANKDAILAWHSGPSAAETELQKIAAAHAAGEKAVRQFNVDPQASMISDPDCRNCTVARKECEKKRESLLSSLNGLIYEADEAQYYYSIDHDLDTLHDKYITWIARITAFMAKNANGYLEQSTFAAAVEPGSSESDIAANFKAKETVLKEMTQQASDGLCGHKVISALTHGTF